MADAKVNFELVPDMDWDDLHDEGVSGRGTSVFLRDTLNGPVVEKFAKEYGAFTSDVNKWFDKQRDAAQISNELRAKQNPHYHVPKTFVAGGKVREEFVDGINADEYIGDKASLIPGIAHFINDMSELRPVRCVTNSAVPGILVKDVFELDKILDRVRKFNVVKEQNLQFIHDLYVFLRDMPENNVLVFGHNDLHSGNVLVNPKDGRLSIIDFELAGFQPMSYMLYNRNTANPALWDWVNKLPRSKNPNLRWNYNARVDEMYSVIHRALFKIECANVYDQDMAMQMLADINMICNPIVRKRFATLKQTYADTGKEKILPLVPMAHYER